MNLEFSKETLCYYDFSAISTSVHEESTETIVPDHCPDIARLIDSDSAVFIENEEITEDKGTVGGTIRINILYTSEGENGIRSLNFSMPFSASISDPAFSGGVALCALVRMQSLETKLLNPRKLFTHVVLSVQMETLLPLKIEICSDLDASPTLGIAQKKQEFQWCPICAYAEKSFHFTDEIALPLSDGGIQEVLSLRLYPTVQETKVFGRKLIVKGFLRALVLYRGGDGQSRSNDMELPFSQIIEVRECSADATISAQVFLAGLSYHIGGDEDPENRSRITVSCPLTAFIFLRDTLKTVYLSDLYSTHYAVSTKTEPALCTLSAIHTEQRVPIRQTIEVGVIPAQILMAAVSFGVVTISREGEQINAHTTAHIKLLFLDEGKVPLIAQRQVECSCLMETEEDSALRVSVSYPGDLTGVLVEGGIEARFSAEFQVQSFKRTEIPVITQVDVDETKLRTDAAPSLTLRCFSKEQTLWSIAKQYATTIDAIRSVNDLAPETDNCPAGQMLMIPKAW